MLDTNQILALKAVAAYLMIQSPGDMQSNYSDEDIGKKTINITGEMRPMSADIPTLHLGG